MLNIALSAQKILTYIPVRQIYSLPLSIGEN